MRRDGTKVAQGGRAAFCYRRLRLSSEHEAARPIKAAPLALLRGPDGCEEFLDFALEVAAFGGERLGGGENLGGCGAGFAGAAVDVGDVGGDLGGALGGLLDVAGDLLGGGALLFDSRRDGGGDVGDTGDGCADESSVMRASVFCACLTASAAILLDSCT
jgi:hypothetical protein